MRQAFLVLGYGIPKNILQDENYGLYLKFVFNNIYERCAATDSWDPVVIFSGGKTDMIKPYRRTEAQEMIRLFRTLSNRPALKPRTKKWLLIPETKAFSTLDNFLYTADILSKRKLSAAPLTIFGERTRQKRISEIAKKVFSKVEIATIDFDQSANRFLDPVFLLKKETEALKLDLWGLQNPPQLKKHRELFKKKFAFLRKAGHKKHGQAVKEWWEQEVDSITDVTKT